MGKGFFAFDSSVSLGFGEKEAKENETVAIFSLKKRETVVIFILLSLLK